MLAPTPVAAVFVLSKPVIARPSLTVSAAYAEPLVAPRTSTLCAPTVVPEGMVTVFEIEPSALAVVADARFTLDEARRRHRALKNEQSALMKTHYAGAVPLAILKSEMDRITREVDATEHQIASSEQALEQLDDQLERALEVARLCHEQYVNAIPAERRLLNQGLFTKLFIGQDGSVEEAEVQELFAGLLSKDSTLAVEAREMAVVPVPTQ
ncbi:hypothetical protein [Microbacterium hydrothermale]|uniref:hypothetical protein n=1 Tax=Microbacterium hydrothermale TaxID=857427 RepID=UPI0010A90618|nr:hypothetical protein [Microbacterium hydrothermale]